MCNINIIDSRLLVELAQLDNLLPHARYAVKLYIYIYIIWYMYDMETGCVRFPDTNVCLLSDSQKRLLPPPVAPVRFDAR